LFFIAMSTAVECSAALPMIATTITPTKTSVNPNEAEAASTAPTRNSLMSATSAVAPRSVTIDRVWLQPWVPIASSPSSCICPW
jgi:hypothetical protein